MENTSSKQSLHAYLMLFTCGCLWAGNAVAGKIAVGHITPFFLTQCRWIIAVVIMLPFAIPHLKRDFSKIRENWPFLALLGSTGFCLFNNLLYSALQHTSAINVAIEQASMPLTLFVFNFILHKVRTTAHQLLGFAITLAGVVVIVSAGNPMVLITLDLNFGDLLMLIAVSLYGVYSVLLARKPSIHWTTFIVVLGTSAALGAVPFMIYDVMIDRFFWPDTTGWLVVLYAAIGPSILAQIFWMQGLSVIGANRGGVFINFVPIIASLMAVLFIGEQFHTYHALALCLVMIGVFISQRGSFSSQPKKPA